MTAKKKKTSKEEMSMDGMTVKRRLMLIQQQSDWSKNQQSQKNQRKKT